MQLSIVVPIYIRKLKNGCIVVTCARPAKKSQIWRTVDAVHVDLRGPEPPEPVAAILRMIDGDEIDTALVAHLDREPIFLYPELEDREWHHELI